MTLYCWIHWFWITVFSLTFTDSVEYSRNVTTAFSNLKNNPNISEVTPFLYNNSSVSVVANQTDNVVDLPKLSNTSEQKVFANSHPQNQSNVIDRNYNHFEKNLTSSSNTSLKNISCSGCNDVVNNSSLINDNYNQNQSFSNSSNYSKMDAQNMTSESSLSAASITGISLGCLGFMMIITVTAFVVYRNWGFNRPQVLSDHCSNPDSSGYIDDSTMRENSEEMYSLDNDSFLNSLEAMTIQNLWTDTVKHTKL